MKEFLRKDTNGNWNVIPPVPIEKFRNINCHKFVLFMTGIISRKEMLSDPKVQKEVSPSFDFTFEDKARKISQKEFTLVSDLKALYELAGKNRKEDKVFIGQIMDAGTGEMAHSFIMESTLDGKYICYDKAGFKLPFSIYEPDELFRFENYRNQKWRFVPLNSFRINLAEEEVA